LRPCREGKQRQEKKDGGLRKGCVEIFHAEKAAGKSEKQSYQRCTPFHYCEDVALLSGDLSLDFVRLFKMSAMSKTMPLISTALSRTGAFQKDIHLFLP